MLREARLRAGLSQQELAAVSGKDRTVIARYEQGVVAPSIDTLVEILRSCGFDIPLELVPYDSGAGRADGGDSDALAGAAAGSADRAAQGGRLRRG